MNSVCKISVPYLHAVDEFTTQNIIPVTINLVTLNVLLDSGTQIACMYNQAF